MASTSPPEIEDFLREVEGDSARRVSDPPVVSQQTSLFTTSQAHRSSSSRNARQTTSFSSRRRVTPFTTVSDLGSVEDDDDDELGDLDFGLTSRSTNAKTRMSAVATGPPEQRLEFDLDSDIESLDLPQPPVSAEFLLHRNSASSSSAAAHQPPPLQLPSNLREKEVDPSFHNANMKYLIHNMKYSITL